MSVVLTRRPDGTSAGVDPSEPHAFPYPTAFGDARDYALWAPNLSDDNDATGAWDQSAGVNKPFIWRLGFKDFDDSSGGPRYPVLDTDHLKGHSDIFRIEYVQLRSRMKIVGNFAQAVDAILFWATPGSGLDLQMAATTMVVARDGVFHEWDGPKWASNGHGADWSPDPVVAPAIGGAASEAFSQINAVLAGLAFYDDVFSPSGDIYLSELYLDVSYRRRHTVTITSPTGGTSPTRPTISWTVSAADNTAQPQQSYAVRVYTRAETLEPGFDPWNPALWPPAWSVGETQSSSVRSITLPVDLDPGVAYRAYVFVRQPWPGHKGAWWNATTYVDFTPLALPAASPTVEVIANSDLGRFELTLTNNQGALGNAEFNIARSIDDGVTWDPVRAVTLLGTTPTVVDDDGNGNTAAPAAGIPVVYLDYEAPRGVPVLYGVYVSGSLSGGLALSPRVTQENELRTDQWFLKDPLEPTDGLVIEVANWTPEQHEATAFFDAVGREDAIAVSDGRKADRGEVGIYAKDRDTYETLIELLGRRHTLLVQDTLGRQWYLRIGDVRKPAWDRAQPLDTERTPLRHYHVITVPWTEVAKP